MSHEECCDRMTHMKRHTNTFTASFNEASVYPVSHGSKSVGLTSQRYINKDFGLLNPSTMHSPVFFAHIKVSTMHKQSVVQIDSYDVQSSSRPRSNSLTALTQRFMSTLSFPTNRRSGSSSSSSILLSSPRTHSHPQTKSHTRSFSNSLRSLFAGRKSKTNTVAISSDDEETKEESLEDILDLFPSCPSTLPQWKGHDTCSPTVLRTNDPMLLPARAFDDDEDTSEPDEEDFLLIQELVLEKINKSQVRVGQAAEWWRRRCTDKTEYGSSA
ncbi:hypothetical protein CPB85DRAFT_1458385 [Mucidula mucida]|nr:hypothetical protein CPB85DRAFT_1458385 [Mucidula mucida]